MQLSKDGTTLEDVIRVLGEPESYLWGDTTFKKENLPKTYVVVYPKGIHLLISGGNVKELRSEEPGGPGFSYRGIIHLGSTLDEVLQALGQPSKTLTSEPLDFLPDVLYKDIDGKTGYCYYARPDKNVRLFFKDYKVGALYITGDESENLKTAKENAAVTFSLDGIEAKIAQFTKGWTSANEVIRAFGEPKRYVWGNETFKKDDLPDNYIMRYPKGISVWMKETGLVEVRSEQPGPGCSYRDKIRLGSSLDDVLKVVGEPSDTITGKKLDFIEGVLYKDTDGKKGSGYYSRPDQNVRFFFWNNKVSALYILPPDIDAKIDQLGKKGTTAEDVMRILGEPRKYLWGNESFTKDNLPSDYCMMYPRGVFVWIRDGKIMELRCESAPGFTYHNLRLGSTLDEVLQLIGQPTETIVGKKNDFTEGVLHKDNDGVKGNCYYARPDKTVRLFFQNYKVVVLYVTLFDNETLKKAKDDKKDASAKSAQAADVVFDKQGLTIKPLPRGLVQAIVSIRNQGNAPSPKLPVLFYAGDPKKDGRLLSPAHSVGPIMPKDVWHERAEFWELKDMDKEVFVLIDPENTMNRPPESKDLILSKVVSSPDKDPDTREKNEQK